jgi:hypothetical protein
VYSEPFVDADDIADVAVAALVDEGHTADSLRRRRPPAAREHACQGRCSKRGDFT